MGRESVPQPKFLVSACLPTQLYCKENKKNKQYKQKIDIK